MRRIIHFFDDKKFLEAAISKFSADRSIHNLFLDVGQIKLSRTGSVTLVSLPSSIINLLIPILHLYFDVVIIHGFFNSFFSLKFYSFNPKLRIMGIFWGFDLYNLKGSKKLYLDASSNDFDNPNSLFSNKLNSNEFENFIENRLNFVSTVIPNEFQILNSYFPSSKLRFCWFSYFDLEDDVLKGINGIELKVTGNNLLFGNNASLWNNHLDGIEIIKSFSFDFEDVVCPLSYSGSDAYKTIVLKRFQEEFNGRFQPLLGVLKYSAYQNILSSCKFVFFNSKRQIGLGNLLFLLYLGSIVILNRQNPLFDFFNSNGIKVFSVEEAKNDSEFKFDLRKSRQHLQRLFGKDAVKTRTFSLIKTIFSS